MRDVDLIRAFRQDVVEDDAARGAARNRLRAHIASASSTAPARRRRRFPRRGGFALAAVLVVCSTAAAAGVLLSSDDLDLGSVACLSSARTIDARASGSAVFVEPSADPVAACAPLWRAGHIDGRRHATAPALVACASAGRPVVVIPGTPATCRELELEPLPKDFAGAAALTGRAKAILQRDGDLHRPLSRCDDPDEVLARARRLLADAGIEGFPVEVAGDRPCAGVYLFDGGAVARIETLSRGEAGDYYERRLIGAALEPLVGTGGCDDPLRAAAQARRLLRAAGLSHVAVRVEDQGGRCLAGGFAFGEDEVVLGRATREQAASGG